MFWPQVEIPVGAEAAGSVGFDRLSAFRAEKWAAPGAVPLDREDDEGESPPGDLPGGPDRSVGRASSGLSLDFGGHDLPPVMHLDGPPGQRPSGSQLNVRRAIRRPAAPHAATISRSRLANPSPVVCGL